MADSKLKGAGLVLVTGKKGSGKSHFVTSEINNLVKHYPDHKVYANIDGLTIAGVEPSPDDWQTVPNNCTIVYDEAQRLSWADNSSRSISSDNRVKEMTMIRHQNKNIVLITQDPMFIHPALRKLVDVHYHISHPFKDGKPHVFKFLGAYSNIDDKGVYKNFAVEEYTYHLDADTSKLYKSVDDGAQHDQKKRIPKKIIYMVILVILLIIGSIIAFLVGGPVVYKFIWGKKTADVPKQQVQSTTQGANASDVVANGVGNMVASAVPASYGMGLDYDQLQIVKDEVRKKYLAEYTVEVADDDVVRPASVISSGNRCYAYNVYGDRLHISNSQCLHMINNYGAIPRSHREQHYNNDVPKQGITNEYDKEQRIAEQGNQKITSQET